MDIKKGETQYRCSIYGHGMHNRKICQTRWCMWTFL
jgi:hypothetical protein